MKPIYKEAKKELESKGIDFKKNVYSLSDEQNRIIESAAKKYGYKVSGCGNSSIGRILHARFFLLLQRIK